MRVQDQSGPDRRDRGNPVDPLVIDGLKLLRAFVKITDPGDRHRVIAFGAELAPASDEASPPIAPR